MCFSIEPNNKQEKQKKSVPEENSKKKLSIYRKRLQQVFLQKKERGNIHSYVNEIKDTELKKKYTMYTAQKGKY